MADTATTLKTNFWLILLNHWAILVETYIVARGARVRQRSRVAYVTGASNWDWLTAGQGLLPLQQLRVEGECFYFLCFFTFIHFLFSPLSLSFIPYTVSCIYLPLFSMRRHKMTHKGWRVVKHVKPQHYQSIYCSNRMTSRSKIAKFVPIGSPRWPPQPPSCF